MARVGLKGYEENKSSMHKTSISKFGDLNLYEVSEPGAAAFKHTLLNIIHTQRLELKRYWLTKSCCEGLSAWG